MSHYMTALAMKQRGLPPYSKILLYWLADHHNAETNRCFPSITRLSKLCEISKRSVQNHLQNLKTFDSTKSRRRSNQPGRSGI